MKTVFIQEEKVLEHERQEVNSEPEYQAALEHYDGYYDSIVPENDRQKQNIDGNKLRNVILLAIVGICIIVACFLFVF